MRAPETNLKPHEVGPGRKCHVAAPRRNTPVGGIKRRHSTVYVVSRKHASGSPASRSTAVPEHTHRAQQPKANVLTSACANTQYQTAQKVNRHPAAKTRTQSSSNSTRCLANHWPATHSGISRQKRTRRLADYVYAQRLLKASVPCHCLRHAVCNMQLTAHNAIDPWDAPPYQPRPFDRLRFLRLVELLCQTALLQNSIARDVGHVLRQPAQHATAHSLAARLPRGSRTRHAHEHAPRP